jgi:hypothetical protein
VAANEDVQWCDPRAVGFVAIRLGRDTVNARFLQVQDPRARESMVRPVKMAAAA